MYSVLVCDDEADIVSALEIYLSSAGYRGQGHRQILGQGGFSAFGTAGNKVGHFAPSTENLSPSRISSR